MDNPHTLNVRANVAIGALQLDVAFSTQSAWTVLFGPSGSGKSTVLRLIAGLWRPPHAAVSLNTTPLGNTPPHKRRIAMVAQQPALFPHKTVRQNIAFGCDSSTGVEWVEELIKTFNLTAHSEAPPATLSGGERQRVAIARALGATPQYLLLDEVFTGMHAAQRQQLIATLRTYSERLNMPILSVTHDVAEALHSANETLKIESGRIIAQGPTATVLAPEREALQHQLTTLK